MAQFVAFNPTVEVNGETVLSIVNGMEMFKKEAFDILKTNGIDNPKPGLWYPQQAWLNAFKTISEKLGANTLFLIGKKIPESAQWPPFVDNIEKALGSIDIAYHMNHRIGVEALFNPMTGVMKEGIGHYGFSKAGDTSVVMVCNNPYPCDFDRGIIDAAAKKFKPSNVLTVNTRHDDSQPCRKKGHDSCTYLVNW
jgi:hypothetical protein